MTLKKNLFYHSDGLSTRKRVCQGLEALLLFVSVCKCYCTTGEKRVTEWSRPQSRPSKGVSLRGHGRGEAGGLGRWVDG